MSRPRVPENKVNWNVEYPEYKPVFKDTRRVIEEPQINPPMYVDYNIDLISKKPLNPRGRTGMCGPGRYRCYGPNKFEGLIISRIYKNEVQLLMRKGFSGDKIIDIPYDVVLPQKSLKQHFSTVLTLNMLQPHVNLEESFTNAVSMYQDYKDSICNTDNAWGEIEIFHVRCQAAYSDQLKCPSHVWAPLAQVVSKWCEVIRKCDFSPLVHGIVRPITLTGSITVSGNVTISTTINPFVTTINTQSGTFIINGPAYITTKIENDIPLTVIST